MQGHGQVAIITFAQVKGGSGKTTAAMCTVAELVARGGTAAALDLDPNRPLSEFFRRVPELREVEVAVPSSDRRVSGLVRELASRHDNVVIDLMGAATNDTQVAMALADLVIVPSQMSGTDRNRRGGDLATGRRGRRNQQSHHRQRRLARADQRRCVAPEGRGVSPGAIYAGRGLRPGHFLWRSRCMEGDDLQCSHSPPARSRLLTLRETSSRSSKR